jgi:hypothetical protein
MSGLRVLFTNALLDVRAGSELYVRDVATALLDRGHTPVVYSPMLGQVGAELRAATIPVVDDLDALGAPPDVIHGHHHLETLAALLHFPGVPAVAFCHGWLPWQEAPPTFPRIRRYVAIDDVCRDRLVLELGVPDHEVCVVRNFVDLARFAPRRPLPSRPARALVFSNGAAEDSHLPAVREACARLGLAVDVVGHRSGQPSDAPEAILGRYDVVFAKGRCALEALAVGAAVVVCDAVGAGPMVTTAEFARLRAQNFGVRAMRDPVDVEHLVAQLRRYDADDAARVSARVRAEAGREPVVDELIGIYREAIAAQAGAAPADPVVEARAAARSLGQLGELLSARVATYYHRAAGLQAHGAWLEGELAHARADAVRLGAEVEAASTERARSAAAAAALRAAYDTLAEARDGLAREHAAARDELRFLHGSRAIRARDRILATPGIGALVRVWLRLGKGGTARLRPV